MHKPITMALQASFQIMRSTVMMFREKALRRSFAGHPQSVLCSRLAFIALCIIVSSCSLNTCTARSLQFRALDGRVLEDGRWSIMDQSRPTLYGERNSVPRRFVGTSSGGGCSENYGFLPCSTTLGGNLFLLLIYGFFLLKAAQLLSAGSELLLTVLNPGIIGGLVLPILGASPDALLILVSGIAASEAEAQSQVLVGMGLLAGSTVMLLTIVWGGCIVAGRCDLQDVGNGKIMMKPRTLTKNFSLFETGVSTDFQTKIVSWIMMSTILPYIVVQIPRIFGHPVSVPFKAIGCALAIIGLLGYCGYQVTSPWLQERRIAMAREQYHKMLSLKKASQFSREKWGGLLQPDGSPNKEVLMKLFSFADKDKDRKLTEAEVRELVMNLGLADALRPHGMETDIVVDKWMSEFDNVEADRALSAEEFIKGMSRWIISATNRLQKQKHGEQKPVDRIFSHAANDAESSLQGLLHENADGEGDGEDDEEDDQREPLTKKQVIFRAVLKIAAGAVLAAIFADPLVDAIDRFSTVSGVPSFFVSFIATPFATNSSEVVSSFLFARKKRKRHLSLAYSQVYGSVTMNNTLCLSVFLAIVLVRGLAWTFSSEVLVIVVVTLIMGLLSGFKVTFPLWMAIFAFALYPTSIALVAILDYVFGWN